MEGGEKGAAEMSAKRAVIVGGGFAGLSAAYTLMRRGTTPLLLEAKECALDRHL